MWSIITTKTEGGSAGAVYNFVVGEERIVGRKGCQILIPNDQSISRKHATFILKHPEANLSRLNVPSALTLKETSKYGTSVNGSKLATDSDTRLKDGDVISFGTFKSNEWRVRFCPLVVAASALPPPEKKSLKVKVHRLGGHVVSEWCAECTHLVMSELNVTIKVISALVACRPIVTPDFLTHTEEAIKQQSDLPTPETYLPPVVEAAINKNEVSFSPNERRKSIFQGKTFFFLTQKQFKRLHVAISMAGGRSELLDEDSDVNKLSGQLTSADQSCVLYTEHQDSSQSMSQAGQDVVSQVLKLLKKHKLRPIPESELGLAVLYVSTAIHCNPSVAQAGLDFLSAVPSQSLPTQSILALETQPQSPCIPRAGGRQEHRAGGSTSKQAASTPHQTRQVLTSTPKISKISETILDVPSASGEPGSSRPMHTSPEFSFKGKTESKVKDVSIAAQDGDKKVVVATLGRKDKEEEEEEEERRENTRTRRGRETEVKPKMKIKVEELSQPGTSEAIPERRSRLVQDESNPTHDTATDIAPGQRIKNSTSMQVKSEPISKTTRNMDKEVGEGSGTNMMQKSGTEAKALGQANSQVTGSQAKQRQGTLDAFRKPERVGDGAGDRRRAGGTNSRRGQDGDGWSVTEEPMDQAETGVEQEMEKVEEEEEEEAKEKEEEDLFRMDRKSVRSRTGAGQSAGTRESTAGASSEQRRRNEKRKGDWRTDQEEEEQKEGERRSIKEEPGSSMWKKKPRVDVFSQEEENAADDSQSREESSNPSRTFPDDVLGLPVGFISARVPIEDQISVKIDRDYVKEEGLPSKVVQVKHTALIVRKKRSPPRTAGTERSSGRPVKNFKKFKKAGYAGQAAIPRIIGGRDLFIHHNNPSKDIEDMFNEEVRAEKKKDEQEEKAERLFALEPRRRPLAKRKR